MANCQMQLVVIELNIAPLNKENKIQTFSPVSFGNAVSSNKLRDMQKCKIQNILRREISH